VADASLGAAPQVAPTAADFAILEHQTGTAGVTETSRALLSDVLALGGGILSGAAAPSGLAQNGTLYARTASGTPPLYVAETTGPWPPTGSVGYSTAQLTNGAVAQYPLADAAGATVAANTKSGSAYGAGSYIGQAPPTNIASLIADQPNSKQLSIANQIRFSAPIVPDSLPVWSVEFVISPASTSDQRIAGTGDVDAGGAGFTFVWTPGGGLVLYLNIGGVIQTIADASVAFDGSRKYIALTYDGTTYTLYVQGVAVGTYAGAALEAGSDFVLGDTYEGRNVNGIDGGAAGVAFYAAALTAAQVATHYDALDSGGANASTATTWATIDVGSASGAGYDAAIMAESALQHYWKCNDAPGATTAADATGGAALTTYDVAVSAGAGIVFGIPLIGDGETGLATDGAGSYLTIPAASIPTAGPFTWEMIVALNYLPTQSYAFVGSFGPNENNTLGIGANGSYGAAEINLSGVSENVSGVLWTPQKLFHVALTYDGATFLLYMSGVEVYSLANTYPYPAGDGRLGMLSAGTHNTMMRLGKLAVYNAALTQAKITAHAQASGLT
jgi:hypothetical protein